MLFRSTNWNLPFADNNFFIDKHPVTVIYTDNLYTIVIETIAGNNTSSCDLSVVDFNNDNRITTYDLNKLFEYLKSQI